MEHSVTKRLRELLSTAGVQYREVSHPPTRTSEESALARGEPLEVGGKALVLKAGEIFRLCVLSAARKLDTGALKRHFSVKDVRFATPEELLELTELVPGSVPPFGEPVLSLPLFLDDSIPVNDRIAFNAGDLTLSFILAMPDYLRVAKPTFLRFSKEASA